MSSPPCVCERTRSHRRVLRRSDDLRTEQDRAEPLWSDCKGSAVTHANSRGRCSLLTLADTGVALADEGLQRTPQQVNTAKNREQVVPTDRLLVQDPAHA